MICFGGGLAVGDKRCTISYNFKVLIYIYIIAKLYLEHVLFKFELQNIFYIISLKHKE